MYARKEDQPLPPQGHHYAPRSIVFDIGESLNRIYVLRGGLIRLGFTDLEGNGRTSEIIRPGAAFGEEALLKCPTVNFAEAIVGSTVSSYSLKLLQNNSSTHGGESWFDLMPSLVRRLRGNLKERRKFPLEYTRPMDIIKISGLLVEIAVHSGEPEPNVHLPWLDQQYIADLMNRNITTINQTIGRLKTIGALKTLPSSRFYGITILDIDKLKTFSSP